MFLAESLPRSEVEFLAQWFSSLKKLFLYILNMKFIAFTSRVNSFRMCVAKIYFCKEKENIKN
jgi:hypothetical protein